MTHDAPRPTSMQVSDRFRPEARVIRLPPWRTGPAGKPEVLLDSYGEWRVGHPTFVAALEALDAGGAFEDAVQRALLVKGDLQENHVRILLRRWFWQLCREGYLDIPLDPPPARFADRYRRLKEIGRGGIGVVHLCLDEASGDQVVVKHAWGYLTAIESAEKMMRGEDAALRAFDHPGVPRHRNAFERDGLLHVVRDFVEGEPLAHRIAREGVPAAQERIRLLRAAGNLVQHMHERGYLFLDPTPGNFILRPDGSVAVIDVGICRPHQDGRALSRRQAGSRGYAAPELIACGDIGTWSDVFGLGALHHYLLAGKAPGNKWSDEERAEAVAKLDVAPAERALLLDATRADPAARPTLPDLMRRLGEVSS